jgi:hypothetical protein
LLTRNQHRNQEITLPRTQRHDNYRGDSKKIPTIVNGRIAVGSMYSQNRRNWLTREEEEYKQVNTQKMWPKRKIEHFNNLNRRRS